MTAPKETVKVWITKYALTKGLFEMEAEIVDNKYASGRYDGLQLFTRDWAHSRAEAVAVAENMRESRLKSLKKSIAKLEKMPFR